MSAAMSEDPQALQAARVFTSRGWRPFPVEYGGKRPAVGIKWGTATASKPGEETLRLWFGRNPVNIGISAKGSRLTFLDDDTGTADAMEKLCEAYGQEVPKTYRVRTSKGWHWYFATPEGAEIANAGQGSYLKDEFGFDVRGNRGGQEHAGGYVVGPGSVHESGHVYRAEDPDVEVAELPEWLHELLQANSAVAKEPTAEPGVPDPERRYTMDQAAKYVREEGINPLKAATEGGRNNALNDAAVVTGHFVPAFYSESEATEALTRIAEAVGLDPREIGPTIRSGLRKGMSEPYTLVEADPFESASDSSGSESDAFEGEVARKVRELKIMEEARRRFSEERNSYRPRIADNVVDDLDDIEPPAMLLGSLIPESAIGFIAGRSGAYKSFLAVGWGCCIATGRAWLGKPEFTVRRPLKTLYVAAEGLAGAVGRIRAWEAATGVSRRGRLMVHKRPIHLNDPAQVDELAAYITKHGFEFVIIDTYHRAAPGVDENNSTEFSVVFAAAARLRDDCNCGVLFVDHTGHGGNGRPRGSSAKGDDADYVLSSGYEGTTRGSDVQRTLTVLKLKDEESGAEWPIRLTPVEGQHFPVVDLGTVNEAGPFGLTEDLNEWWRADRLPEIPPRVAEAIAREAAKCDNRGADAARWVWRYLAFVDDEQGLTRTQILNALQLIPRDRPFGKTAVDKAYPLLDHAGLVGRDKSRVWLLP